MIVQQGDIYMADLSPVVGSEQGGVRPVVIVQNNIGNRFSPTVIVAVITRQIKRLQNNRPKLPTHVLLSREKYNIQFDSVILLEQIRTIDKVRLLNKIDSLDSQDLEKVKNAWMISAGINLDDNESVEKTTEKIESFYRFVQGTVFENIEDIEYEFKEPKGTNPLNTIKDTVAKYVCAFLNANGGRILYGITDKERIIKGITATPQQIDEIKRVIYDKCKGVNPGISPDQIQIYFHELFNKDNKKLENQFVLEVVVPTPIDKSIIHFISNGKELYVRVNGSSRKLEGAEIVSYTLNKYRIQLNNKNEWK